MNKIVALLMLIVVALMVVQVQAAPKFRFGFKRNAATASGPTRSAASQSSLPSVGQPSPASVAPPRKTGFMSKFKRNPVGSPATAQAPDPQSQSTTGTPAQRPGFFGRFRSGGGAQPQPDAAMAGSDPMAAAQPRGLFGPRTPGGFRDRLSQGLQSEQFRGAAGGVAAGALSMIAGGVAQHFGGMPGQMGPYGQNPSPFAARSMTPFPDSPMSHGYGYMNQHQGSPYGGNHGMNSMHGDQPQYFDNMDDPIDKYGQPNVNAAQQMSALSQPPNNFGNAGQYGSEFSQSPFYQSAQNGGPYAPQPY
ncbi:hypothetical protein MP228_012957 [Amoeboaphelidium protococcarum]|nr:hypothetical protein MP228_012957 [Amoeboaphelidium protococcarum]